MNEKKNLPHRKKEAKSFLNNRSILMSIHDTASKNHILQCTFILLLEKGYDAVSISDIQERAGISRGLLYHYFGNKEALFEEACLQYLILCFSFDSSYDEEMDLFLLMERFLKKYESIGNNTWAPFPIPEEVNITHYDFLINKILKVSLKVDSAFTRVWERERKLWEKAAAYSQGRGQLRTDITSESIASMFICMVYGVWMESFDKGSTFLLTKLEEMFGHYYQLIRV